jgi:hypothetical protein
MALSIAALAGWWWLPKAALSLLAVALMARASFRPAVASAWCAVMALIVLNNLLQV